MKTRNFSIQKNKKYLIAFIFVMLLNLSLSAILLRVSFGQTKKADFLSQQPVSVKVAEQKDCPLRIMIINVDNSALSYQTINYSLQNISNKPIRAYTLVGVAKNDGKVVTSSFATEFFQPNKYEFDNFFIERETIKDEKTVLLLIDYVEFEDDSFWGTDSQGQSKELAGEREGRKVAIRQLKNSIKNGNTNITNDITNLLKQDIKDIIVDVPDTNKSDEWKKGFKTGYKTVISVLQDIEEQGNENLIKKLDEMEKIAN